jgi:hypothetical protein
MVTWLWATSNIHGKLGGFSSAQQRGKRGRQAHDVAGDGARGGGSGGGLHGGMRWRRVERQACVARLVAGGWHIFVVVACDYQKLVLVGRVRPPDTTHPPLAYYTGAPGGALVCEAEQRKAIKHSKFGKRSSAHKFGPCTLWTLFGGAERGRAQRIFADAMRAFAFQLRDTCLGGRSFGHGVLGVPTCAPLRKRSTAALVSKGVCEYRVNVVF